VARDPEDRIGLGHVATVSFLASRAAPSAQFWLALGGGVALARTAMRAGARTGFGVSLAAMLQTVAVMGPARVNAPLTQALTAPVMGRLQARHAPAWVEFLACLAIRLVHYAVLMAFFVFVVLGGIDAVTTTYERLTGWLGVVPDGPVAALGALAAGNVAWALFFSVTQVAIYRRALGAWPAPEHGSAPVSGPGGTVRATAVGPGDTIRTPGRFDPRAVVLAAVLASGLLLASTAWLLLIGVLAWLVPAWLLAKPDRDALPLGAALAGMLAFAALTGGLLGGAGLELTLRRALRAVLLVAVATWMRAAAGPDGLRETFRRALSRLHRLPGVAEASVVFAGLDAGPRLIAAGRAAANRFSAVELRPTQLADALTLWVATEAAAYAPGAGAPRPALRLRAPDGLLLALTLAPAFALVGH